MRLLVNERKLIRNLLSFVIVLLELCVWFEKVFDWDFVIEDNGLGRII